MADPLCFAMLGALGFAYICNHDTDPACTHYARMLKNPRAVRLLADWRDSLPVQMDVASLKAQRLAALERRPAELQDDYVIPLTLDPALLGLDPQKATAAVSLDPVTGALVSASITDGRGAYFVVPPDRLAGAYGQKELKLPRTDKVGMYCYRRD